MEQTKIDNPIQENQPLITYPKKRFEFSKIVVSLVLATYFVGVIFGAVIVWQKVPEEIGYYLGYVGAATGGAISFYLWKAKAENVIKLNLPLEHLKGEDSYGNHNNYSGYGSSKGGGIRW